MAERFLPTKDALKGRAVGSWTLVREIGRGNNGVVYKGENRLSPVVVDEAAIKLIPIRNLRSGWESEIHKAVLLEGIDQIVAYKSHSFESFDNGEFAAVLWRYVRGMNLNQYVQQYPLNITIPFIESLIEQVLRAFIAMDRMNICHGDLHEGNIIIADADHRELEITPKIKVADFGIGCSLNNLKPKDDYLQLAAICHRLLERIDPATLTAPTDRLRYRHLVSEFLPKYLFEKDPTVGDFVRNPRTLIEKLRVPSIPSADMRTDDETTLESPFDYLSCEQMGDSFHLLHALYSQNFPGYDDLLQKTNSIFTGPRGCGKTTIFRNLSLKTQIRATEKQLVDLDDYIGIYYHCGDLYFPFQYLRDRPTETDRRCLIHYFNLALLREILETLIVAQNQPVGQLDYQVLIGIQEFLKTWFQSYCFSTQTDSVQILGHLLSVVEAQKHRVSTWLQARRRESLIPDPLLPTDFLPKLCGVLCNLIPWMRGRTIYFFLDDYSLPHISERMQETLHDCIFFRWSTCYFKVATESITTFYPYDTSGKLLEETREYSVVDLGAHFFAAADQRADFLAEVINNRLTRSKYVHPDYHDIRLVLGSKTWPSYNGLAEMIRDGKRVYYSGYETLSDLFSGDIAHMLYLVRNMFLSKGRLKLFESAGLTITAQEQNFVIREYAGNFLARIGYAPGNGPRLVKVAQAFGDAAHWLLVNRTSKNEDRMPPWQTFRIVVRTVFSFRDLENFRPTYERLVPVAKRSQDSLKEFAAECESVYNDLLKYAVFLRDSRGKSFRGAVVAQLYLRRLLIPKFSITPSQRDSVSLEPHEFVSLLAEPQYFQKIARKKFQDGNEQQNGLFDEE